MSTAGVRPQLFGTKKSADTRKAQRFFAERRVPVHFVDLAEKGASLGELRRFAQKHGVQALIDREGKRFAELGLRTAMYGDERWLTLLVDEPLLLRQPLVRIGAYVGIGVDETAWKAALQALPKGTATG